jgi:hypothetical protein
VKTSLFTIFFALAAASFISAPAAAYHGSNPEAYLLAQGLAPVLPAPNPVASVWYLATWSLDNAPGSNAQDKQSAAPPSTGALRYCVSPAIEILPRPGSKTGPEWSEPFTIELVNAAGQPADPSFNPVTVPVPLAVNTTVKLSPVPVWCGTVPGASQPPELYLRVCKSRVRVEFRFLPPTRSTTIIKLPPNAASSPR